MLEINGERVPTHIIIKPSTPTPPSLKTHHLSYLDQIGPPVYIPIVFFYKPNPNFNPTKISQTLKHSLSQTLSHFYPLAGKLEKNSVINCDDAGVDFVETQIDAPLSHFIENPKTENLRRLIPVDSSETATTIFSVQLSFFSGGGFSVGACCCHKAGDYASYTEFLNSWAAAARGETLVPRPLFDLAVRFPPKTAAVEHFSKDTEKIVTKRLVFTAETLEKMRAKSVCVEVKNPSRVEAVSAFIWKMFIDATKAKRGPDRSLFAALHAVNLRARSDPPISDRTFGNCYVATFSFTSKSGIHDLVSRFRGAFRSVTTDYIKNTVSDGDQYLNTIDVANESFKNGSTELCNFSSWWRFPVYEVNFGWGKPCWVATVAQPYKNLVLLMATPDGNGIEAWINMPHDFSKFFETTYNDLLLAK